MRHQGTEVHAITGGQPVAQRAAGGGYFRIESASYPVDVTLLFSNGNPETYTGRKAGWKWRPGIHANENRRRFTGYIIESEETQSVIVDVVESADADMTPVSELTVKDTTTGRAAALRGEAFICDMDIAGGVGVPQVQLRNPVASGVNVVLKALAMYDSVAPAGYLVQRKTNQKENDFAALVTAANKKLGGAVGAAIVSEDNGVIGYTVQTMGRISVEAAAKTIYWDGRDKEIIIPEGEALILATIAGSSVIKGMMEWEEEEA